MSVDDATVSFSLEVNVDESAVELRRLTAIVSRMLSALDTAGLPPDVAKAIKVARTATVTINQLRLAAAAMQAFWAGTAGPFGLPLAFIAIFSAYGATSDMLYDAMRGT